MAADKKYFLFIERYSYHWNLPTFEEFYDEGDKIDIDHEFGFGVNPNEPSVAVKYSTVFNCSKKALH